MEQQNVFYRFLNKLPVPVCGVTLGLAAVGNMLNNYSTALHWLYMGFAAILWLALLVKLILCWPQAKKELANPMAFSVFEAFFMTLLQFAAVMAPYNQTMALCFWWLAVIGGLVLIVLFSRTFLRRFQLANVYTSWNVLYGGGMLATVVAPAVHMETAGFILFWLHFIIFLPWYPISAYRYWKLPVAEAAWPTVCILAAPFNLTTAGYLAGVPQLQLWMAVLFAAIGQMAYLFVLTRLPGILKLPFYPSYGALTFPFVIPAVALQTFLVYMQGAGVMVPLALHGIVLFEQVLAVVMVTYATIRYVMYLRNV